MRIDVKESAERLFSACLAVTASGRATAFFGFEAHVNSLHVSVYAPGQDYTAKPHPESFMSFSAYLVPFNWDNAEAHAAETIRKLDDLTIQLYAIATQEAAA